MSDSAQREAQLSTSVPRIISLALAGAIAVSALSACDPGESSTGTDKTSTGELSDDDNGLDGMQVNPGTGDIGFYDGTGMPL